MSPVNNQRDSGPALAYIQIKREFTMPRAKLRKELGRLATSMQDQWHLNCIWQSDDCLDFRHSGARGRIEIGDQEFELNAKLGLLMSAFKGPIEDEIRKFIDTHVY
jgi:putative polyhydroxyalkanoate system protein